MGGYHMSFYLSRGSRVHETAIYLRGLLHILTPIQMECWTKARNGLYSCSGTDTVVYGLYQRGLVIYTSSQRPEADHRLLTNALISPVLQGNLAPVSQTEQWLLDWILKAGIHLTVPELVCLREKGVLPVPALTGEENSLELVETIYGGKAIAESKLELKMELANRREEVVSGIFSLLERGYIEIY